MELKNPTLMSKSLALFDFDGTITSKDTFLYFIKYTHPIIQIIGKGLLVSPYLTAFLLGIMSNETAKTKLFGAFYKGISTLQFDEWGKGFLSHINSFVKPKALERIKWHKENGHQVIVISAGFDLILKHWCQQENIELISTRLEVENGKITGRLMSPNCYGIEKVNRLRDYLNLSDFTDIYAYGDSSGDSEMMKISTFPQHEKRIFS